MEVCIFIVHSKQHLQTKVTLNMVPTKTTRGTRKNDGDPPKHQRAKNRNFIPCRSSGVCKGCENLLHVASPILITPLCDSLVHKGVRRIQNDQLPLDT